MGTWVKGEAFIMSNINYKSAGVDIEAGNEAVRRIKKAVESTYSRHILSSLGGFASMLDLSSLTKAYEHPVLVQSIDGVGTKMIVAGLMRQFDTIGIDLVSATTNDILVLGAKPLTLLDYIAADRIEPEVIERIVSGIAHACKENEIALVGGETAEMPNTYLKGEHDLVGIVTGILEKDKAISGQDIQPGDRILAFASSGLHTNGYSLARKLVFDHAGFTVDTYNEDLSSTWGQALLKPHLNYTKPVHKILSAGFDIKGMAHITGGGLLENIPRVLPEHCSAEIIKARCPTLALFHLLSEIGQLDEKEAYRTFNMGVGYVLIVKPSEQTALMAMMADDAEFPLFEIGQIVEGSPSVRLI